MNGNRSANSSVPLFYIIQPKIKIKQPEQNMQEIFHGKERPDLELETNAEKPNNAINEEGTLLETNVSDNSQPIDLEEVIENSKAILNIGDMQDEIQRESKPEIDEVKIDPIQLSTTEETNLEVNTNQVIDENIEELSNTSNGLKENMQADNTGSIETIVNTIVPLEETVDYRRELRTKLIRLARYPAVVPKPLCQLKLKDVELTGTIVSKRREHLKVKIGETIKFILIDDIEDVTII